MLELKNITKIYNPGEITEACLFRDFNLSVEAGEFVSIVGSNGSGKTSLLNIICGSIPIQGGDVIIDGESMLHKKEFVRYRRFGRVYQNPALGTSPNLSTLFLHQQPPPMHWQQALAQYSEAHTSHILVPPAWA